MRDCTASEADLRQWTAYKDQEECPDDWPLAQKLMFKESCYVLPRRACFAPMPPDAAEPLPLPSALWTVPDD
eukprot:SM010139S09140  [mRNA]  locus=s10139:40:459:- [translate_table: standard]